MRINLRIERLVLDGIEISSGEQELLRESVASELSRMLGKGGVRQGFSEGVSLPRILTSNIQVERGKPLEFGQDIAKSVYGGICGG